MTTVSPFDPNHHYYNQLGDKISLLEWAALREQNCTLAEDRINQIDATDSRLKTVYLGFVDPSIYDARLFGTAIIADGSVSQIQVYDTEADALLGHMSHLESIGFGFHCNICRLGQDHDD